MVVRACDFPYTPGCDSSQAYPHLCQGFNLWVTADEPRKSVQGGNILWQSPKPYTLGTAQ